MIHKRHTCRTCGSTHLCLILDLGKTALANDFIEPAEVAHSPPVCRSVAALPGLFAGAIGRNRGSRSPLLALCLRHLHVADDGSASGGAMPAFAGGRRVRETAARAGDREQHRPLPQKFKAQGCEVLGVEPARNISEVATGRHSHLDRFLIRPTPAGFAPNGGRRLDSRAARLRAHR